MDLVKARYKADFEIRQAKKSDSHHSVSGLAVPFDRETHLFWDLYERFEEGSFKRTIEDDTYDAALLVQHQGLVIARQSNNQVEFRESKEGLEFDAKLDKEDPDVQSLVPKLRNGNISDMSVGFFPKEYRILDQKEREVIVHEDVDLVEASFVSFPQYEGTSAELRSLFTKKEPEARTRNVDNPHLERILVARENLKNIRQKYRD